MKKEYIPACASLRPGQLDRLIGRIKDFNPTKVKDNSNQLGTPKKDKEIGGDYEKE